MPQLGPHLLLSVAWGRGEVTVSKKGLVVWEETGRSLEQVFGQAREREKGVA